MIQQAAVEAGTPQNHSTWITWLLFIYTGPEMTLAWPHGHLAVVSMLMVSMLNFFWVMSVFEIHFLIFRNVKTEQMRDAERGTVNKAQLFLLSKVSPSHWSGISVSAWSLSFCGCLLSLGTTYDLLLLSPLSVTLLFFTIETRLAAVCIYRPLLRTFSSILYIIACHKWYWSGC